MEKKIIKQLVMLLAIVALSISIANAQAPVSWTNTLPHAGAEPYGSNHYNAKEHQANDVLILSDGKAVCSGVAYNNVWEDNFNYYYGAIQKYDNTGNVIATYYGPGIQSPSGGGSYGKILKIVSNANDDVFALGWHKMRGDYPHYNFKDTFSLLKLNSNLELQWSVMLPKNYKVKLAIDVNGNPCVAYAMTGKIVVAKYDKNSGAVVWSKELTDAQSGKIDQLNDLKVDDAGNVYICGSVYSDVLNSRYLVVKINANGTMAWKKFYDGQSDFTVDVANALAIDNNHNVIVTGKSFYNGKGLDFFTLKYDANGNIIWYKRKDFDNRKNGGQFVSIDALNNFYVAGFDGDTGAVFFKYNENGNLLWQNRYANFTINAIKVTAQGDCYLAGHKLFHGSTIESANKAHLKKILANGEVDWAYTDNKDLSVPIILDLDHDYEEVAYNTSFLDIDINTSNNDLIATGTSFFNYYHQWVHSNNAEWFTVAFSPTARMGNLNADYNTNVNLYPNPVSNQLQIQFKDETVNAQLTILDLQGRAVITKTITSANATIDVTELKPGIYVARFIYDGNVVSKKFVKD